MTWNYDKRKINYPTIVDLLQSCWIDFIYLTWKNQRVNNILYARMTYSFFKYKLRMLLLR